MGYGAIRALETSSTVRDLSSSWTPEVCELKDSVLTILSAADEGAVCGVIARQPGLAPHAAQGPR